MIRAIYITMIAEAMPSWCLRPEILSGMQTEKICIVHTFRKQKQTQLDMYPFQARLSCSVQHLVQAMGSASSKSLYPASVCEA